MTKLTRNLHYQIRTALQQISMRKTTPSMKSACLGFSLQEYLHHFCAIALEAGIRAAAGVPCTTQQV
jgi:hypothetical protein